ncbi:MAG TPA: discoidin domain-containing protein [Anaerolineales bacterium]|nr:discoidin domain-containing protein [Anaerolineales bacterium]
MHRFARALRLLILPALGLASCSSLPIPTEVSVTPSREPAPVTQTSPVESPTSVPQEQSEHRIAVRQVNGVGEFYDKETNDKFIPRGANYVFVPLGNAQTNLLLRVGTYDPERTRQDFAILAGLRYNTVRVFLDQCNQGTGCIGDDDNIGLNPDYLDNIADMMSAGQETGIFILFTSNDLPDQGGYSEEANFGSGGTFAGYRNSYYLRPQAITATRRYWRDLLTGLVERNAAFDAVLGWQLLNEQWMFLDQPPLSLTSGIVDTTTGSYDMSDPDQKTQMVSDGMVHYIAQMKEEILMHDPTALVTMGFFAPEIAAPGWYVETASLLERSDLDFFDFHAYPGGPGLQELAEHFGMIGYDAKPILLGEYGAFRHNFSEANSAARTLMQWVAESCQYGFDGWLYWTYYPAAASVDDRTWGLVDEGNYLLDLFAPANQPDPCVAIEIPTDNLAYTKPVTASRSLPEEPPANAVDDNSATQWGSGEGPVQWIEIDLQASYNIAEIRLLVAQYPAGNTTHRVQVRSSSGSTYQTVHEFDVSTNDNDWLTFMPDTPLENVSQIRIQTIASPSWVSWKEIQVYGEAVP